MAKDKEPLKLIIPKKAVKKTKGYYIAKVDIQFIKDEAKRLKCSENDIVTALVVLYQDSIGYKAGDI